MFNLIYLFIFLTLISFLFLLMNFIFSKKMLINREKNSPFECGFDPMINLRLPFSIHFFLISLIFLIFDIEITLLIPLIFLYYYFNKFLIYSCFFFLLILLFSLYIEYTENSIDWKI